MENKETVMATLIEFSIKFLSLETIFPPDERDKKILLDYLLGKSKKELADDYSLSVNRITQILERFLRNSRWSHPSENIFRIFKSPQQKPSDLFKEIELLEEQNQILKFKISKGKIPTQKKQSCFPNPTRVREEEFGRFLNIKLSEKKFSKRTHNCLKAAEIFTLGELICLGDDPNIFQSEIERELLKIRQFGETSLYEIRRFFSSLKIEEYYPDFWKK